MVDVYSRSDIVLVGSGDKGVDYLVVSKAEGQKLMVGLMPFGLFLWLLGAGDGGVSRARPHCLHCITVSDVYKQLARPTLHANFNLPYVQLSTPYHESSPISPMKTN